MTVEGLDLNALEKRLSPDALAERGFPRPKRVQVSFGEDHMGDAAYFVYLIFPNSTSDSDISWKNISPMITWVRDFVRGEDGYRHRPYVQVKREFQMRGIPD